MHQWRRRDVVKAGFTLLAGLPATAASAAPAVGETSASGPFVVRADESRGQKPLTIAGHPFAAALIAGTDVKERFAVLKIDTPPDRGPELHVHAQQNEWFFVQRGSIGLQCGSDRLVLRAGDSFMAPVGLPHAYVTLGTETAALINLFDPAGEIETFFAEYANVLNQPGPPDPKRLAAVYEAHGMQVVGPPLRSSAFTS